MNNENKSIIFKSLGDETRLKIVMMLLTSNELCACKILEKFNITQPTLSYHMKMLVDSKIVNSKKEGPWVIYSLNNDYIDFIKKVVS